MIDVQCLCCLCSVTLHPVSLSIGQEDYDRLRPLSYPQTVRFVCTCIICMAATTTWAGYRWWALIGIIIVCYHHDIICVSCLLHLGCVPDMLLLSQSSVL